MESLGRMIAILLAILFLLLFPIRYEAQKDAIAIDSYLRTELDYFLAQIKNRKEITQTMYQEFYENIVGTGVSYQVDIEKYITYHAKDYSDYLEYEDIFYELTLNESITIAKGDYVLIRITPKTTSIIDRLKNLFLPTFINQESYVCGGKI